MKTTNLQIAACVILIIMTALVVVRITNTPPAEPAVAKDSTTLVATKSSARALAVRSSIASRAVPQDPILNLLPEQVPPASQPYIVRAIQTVQLVEQERGQFPAGSHGDRLLAGIGRKLFMDDWHYAALAMGELDPAQAEAAYQALMPNASNTVERPVVTGAGQPVREPVQLAQTQLPAAASEALTEHTTGMVNATHNPVYGQVWEQVKVYDPHAQTDLFKDALLFTAMYAQMNEWIQQEAVTRAETYAQLTQLDVNPDQLQRSVESYQDISDNFTAEYGAVQASLQNVFLERFRSRGIKDGQEIVNKLRELPTTTPEGYQVGGEDFNLLHGQP